MTASVIKDFAKVQADRDKPLKEDNTMRLTEFADPKYYHLPDAEAAHSPNPIKTIRRDDEVDDAEPRLSNDISLNTRSIGDHIGGVHGLIRHRARQRSTS